MNWKPTSDTSSLTRAMDKKSDCLLFDMCSDALIESGSSVSLWDWLMFSSAMTNLSHMSFSGSGDIYYSGCDFYTLIDLQPVENCSSGCGAWWNYGQQIGFGNYSQSAIVGDGDYNYIPH